MEIRVHEAEVRIDEQNRRIDSMRKQIQELRELLGIMRTDAPAAPTARDENYDRQPDPTIHTVRSKPTRHKQAISSMLSEWL
eukprot:8144127-Pyramimonas_sp.AAC.1